MPVWSAAAPRFPPPISTELCRGCQTFQALGRPAERLRQFRLHWPNCMGVRVVVFAADGAVESVVFAR